MKPMTGRKMTEPRGRFHRRSVAVGALLAVQILCAGFFVFEIGVTFLGLPFGPITWTLYEIIEIGAALGLVFGVVTGALLYRQTLRERNRMAQQLRAASGAFMDVLEEHFRTWRLTPAERDVAMFALKGLSIQEIAQMRSTSEGTVKAQTNAIYKKAQVTGRPQLLSLFIEELMGDGLTPKP